MNYWTKRKANRKAKQSKCVRAKYHFKKYLCMKLMSSKLMTSKYGAVFPRLCTFIYTYIHLLYYHNQWYHSLIFILTVIYVHLYLYTLQTHDIYITNIQFNTKTAVTQTPGLVFRYNNLDPSLYRSSIKIPYFYGLWNWNIAGVPWYHLPFQWHKWSRWEILECVCTGIACNTGQCYGCIIKGC